MDLHDELPTFDHANTIDSIMSSNHDHFLRRNSYYEIALKILANFGECPVVTMDTEGSIQYSIAHDTAFCSSNPQETYMRLLVKPETPVDSRKVMMACQGDVITSFPYKNAIKVSLPSMEDIAKAQDKEALALLFDNIESTTPKQLVYSAVVLPTELMMTILENKTKTPFATLALIWDYFIQEGVLRGPKGGKRTIPDQVVRIINFFGTYHLYHATLEQEESETAKKYKHLMKQFGVISMKAEEMDDKTSESIMQFTHQSLIKLKIIHHSTPMKQNGTNTPEAKDGQKKSKGNAKGNPSKGSPAIPKKQKTPPTQSSLITTMAPLPSTPSPSNNNIPSPSGGNSGCPQPTPPNNSSHQGGTTGGNPINQQNSTTRTPPPQDMSQVAIDALVALKSTIQSVNVNMGAINDSISASTQASGLSHKGVDGWGDIEIAGVKVLSSPDPSNPIDSIHPRTRLLCGMKPTDTIRKIKRDNRNCDWAWNIAMISAISRGEWTMNKRVDGTSKMEGISPPSTPMASTVSKGWYGEDLETFAGKENNSTYAMTYKDLVSMAKTNFFCPEGYAQTEGCFENAHMLSKEFLGEEAHRTKQLAAVLKYLRTIKGEFSFYWKTYKHAFTFSLMAHTHIRLAKFHHNCIYYPEIVSTQSLNLLEIFESISDQTFWNRFQHPAAMNAATISFNLQVERRLTQGDQTIGSEQGETPSDTPMRQRNNKRGNEDRDDDRPQKVRMQTNTDDEMQSDTPFKELHLQFAKMDLAGHQKPKISGNEACLKWHFKGRCNNTCSRCGTHVKPTGGARRYLMKYRKECEKLAEEARNGTSNNA